jgi:hypothetical protein
MDPNAVAADVAALIRERYPTVWHLPDGGECGRCEYSAGFSPDDVYRNACPACRKLNAARRVPSLAVPAAALLEALYLAYDVKMTDEIDLTMRRHCPPSPPPPAQDRRRLEEPELRTRAQCHACLATFPRASLDWSEAVVRRIGTQTLMDKQYAVLTSDVKCKECGACAVSDETLALRALESQSGGGGQ